MTRRRLVWLSVLVALAALVALGVAAAAMLPEVVRRAAVWRLESLTQRRVTIDRVDLDLLGGRVAVHGLQIDDRDEPAPLARADRITGRVHRRSLLELHVRIDDVVVEGSAVRIVRLTGNRFNVSDLLERPPRAPGLVGVTIDRLRVTGGTVVLEDRTLAPARTWTSERIEIDARALSTARGGGSAVGSTVVAGAPVHVTAEDLRLAPVHLRAHVTVGNVDLALLRLYLPGDAAVLPERGVLAAGVTVVHDARDGTRISAGARIRALALEGRGQVAPVATSPETLVTLNDLHLTAGGFALARAELEGDLDVTEAIVGPPVTYGLAATRLVAENVTWPARAPGRVSFTGRLPGGGTLDVRGTVVSDPARADVRVKVSGADLGPLNRYARTLGVLSGTGDADARVVATYERGLRLTVTGSVGAGTVALSDPRLPGAPPALTAERLDASSLEYEWPARISVGSLRIRRPSATVERDATGALAVHELLSRAPAPAESGGGRAGDDGDAAGVAPEITIAEVRIDGGTLGLIDRTVAPAAQAQLVNVTLGLRDVTWPVRAPTQLELAAGLPGGGLVSASGTADGADQRLEAKVTLKNADVGQARPYLPFRGRVSGRADAELDVRGQLDPLRLRVRGDATLTEVAVEDLDRPLLAVERIGATGLDLRWPLRIAIDQLNVRRPWAKIDRNERGELSLRAAFGARPRPDAADAPAGTGAGAPGAPPEIVLGRVLIEEGATSVIDDSVEPAARFEIRGTRVEARNVTYPVARPADVAISTPMPGGGRLEGRGTFQIDPGRMDVQATLAGVALAPAQPYLPVDARVSGTLDGDARVSATFEPLALTVRGNAVMSDLAVGDEHRSLLTAGRARARGVSVQWPGRVRVDSVEVDKPWLLLEREASGRFPLVALLTPRQRGAPRRDPGAKPTPPVRVDIGTVSVSDGFGRFVDRVPQLQFAEELSGLNLTVVGFGTAPGTVARATLRGTVGPAAPLAISGELTAPPGQGRVDVLVTLGGYPAPRANAYLQTLFGWTARQGAITLAAHYVIDGDELGATNDVGAEDLVLERAPGEQAPTWPIGLPLDTFVALLKNRDGDVQLSVPIHGTLSSPEFRLGDATAQALRAIVVKTVTLPVGLVGRLFVTEDARIESIEIDPVLFEAGTTDLAAGMEPHVDRLAQFLRDRPAVRLRLRPVLSIPDVTRLKRVALRERVRAQAGERTPTAMRDALAQLYVERFPRRPPAAVDEMIAALAEHDPAPTAASAALAERRVLAVRELLAARGVEASRLPALDAAAPVEGEGAGRVELELTN
ncbi:MAG TPA: DUF748 domain-containing protein [Methylomirabilota bacterium]|nr:DUF748 domain-containing protein [Methylomirabilota bacterium]